MRPIDRQEELITSAGWVIRAKTVLCGSLLVIFAMANFAGLLDFPLLLFAIAPLLEMTLNLPHHAFLRRTKQPRDLFTITSTLDVLLITWAAYTLGDLGKFLALIIYPLVIIFAGVVMDPRHTYFFANLACASLSTLTWLEMHHTVPVVQSLMLDLSGASRFALLLLIWPLYNFLAYFVRYLAGLLRQREGQLLESAFRDELTNLPSRDLFLERLRQAMARADSARAQGRPAPRFAVLFLDLDRFNIINASLGHHLGDQLLMEAARRLEACVNAADTVARLSGDEYLILLEDYQDDHMPIRLAERIQEVLTLPFDLNGHEAFTSASVGIALGAASYHVPEEIIQDAHTAMYRAKAHGKACHALFEEQMRPRAVARLELESELRHAVDRQELRVHYQPIRAVATNNLVGFEALVRWHHPQRGLIMPHDFIPMAEEVGLITPIGWWVLQEACQTLRRWHERYPAHTALTMSVNLSGEQLKHQQFLEQLSRVVAATGVRTQMVKLEITESVLIEYAEATLDQMAHIQELGIAFYLDDFGTGYSSLSYLRRFNVEKLKIDRSFIARLERSPKDLNMVRHMIRLAHGLEMQVVAEGVETPTQLEQLRHLRCDYAQGYYFSKPVPVDQAEALLKAPTFSSRAP